VQWNNSGVFGGDPDFTWNNTAGIKLLDIFTPAGNPGISVEGGFIQSAQGFLAHSGTAIQYNSIQAPSGGVLAKSVNVSQYLAFTGATGFAAMPGDDWTNKMFLYYESTNDWMYLRKGAGLGRLIVNELYCGLSVATPYIGSARTDDSWHWIMASSAPAVAQQYGMRIAGAQFELYDLTHGNWPFYIIPNTDGREALVTMQTARVSGGLRFVEQVSPTPGPPPVSVAGEVRIYASGDHTLKISTNGAAYGPFGGGGTPGGGHLQVQYNSSGTFAAVADLTFDPAPKLLNIGAGSTDTACRIQSNSTGQVRNPSTGVLGPNTPAGDIHWRLHRPWIRYWDIGIDPGARFVIRDGSNADMVDFAIYPSNAGDTTVIAYTPGYFQGQNGFYTPGTNYDIIKAPGGGALVETLSFARRSTAPATFSGTTGNGEVKMYAKTDGVMYISTNGAAWAPFGAAGAATQIQYKSGGGFGASGDLTWDDSAKVLNVWGHIRMDTSGAHSWNFYPQVSPPHFIVRDETPGYNNTLMELVPSTSSWLVFVYTPGYFESGYGFNSQFGGHNAFRGNGGISVQCVRAQYYTHIGISAPIPATGAPVMIGVDSLSYGCMFYDSTNGLVKVYTSAGWKTVYCY
jgi:hypothetical protein